MIDGYAWPPVGGGYARLGEYIGGIVDDKQKAYGDAAKSCGAALALLYPNGVQPNAYADLLTIARVWDKLSRVATAGGAADPMGEDPWMDIAGYAMLAYARNTKGIHATMKGLGVNVSHAELWRRAVYESE